MRHHRLISRQQPAAAQSTTLQLKLDFFLAAFDVAISVILGIVPNLPIGNNPGGTTDTTTTN